MFYYGKEDVLFEGRQTNMKAIFSGVKKEFKLIFRNGLSLYMALAPAVMALVFIMIFGVVQSSSVAFAVNPSIPYDSIAKLERVADIEFFESDDEVKLRVGGTDSVSGIIFEDGSHKVIVEGNEGEEFAVSMKGLVAGALKGETISYNTEKIEGDGGFAYRLSLICILLMALFVGGATLGLSCVDEGESKVIHAVAVSPTTIIQYVATKLIPGLLIGIVGVVLSTVIIGKSEMIVPFVLLSLFSVFVSGFVTFILAFFAKNQIAAIGVLKLLMPSMMVLPISAMFVSQTFQFFYYVFPMYWQYRAIDGILSGAFDFGYILMTFIISIPWFLALVVLFAKKTKIGVGR